MGEQGSGMQFMESFGGEEPGGQLGYQSQVNAFRELCCVRGYGEASDPPHSPSAALDPVCEGPLNISPVRWV